MPCPYENIWRAPLESSDHRNSENAVLQERVEARESFGGVEGRGAGRDAVGSESDLRGSGNGLLRQRMRQRFECSVVFESEMRAFVGFDKDGDGRRVIELMRRSGHGCIAERHPVRIRKAGRVALPGAQRCQVIAFSGHGNFQEPSKH